MNIQHLQGMQYFRDTPIYGLILWGTFKTKGYCDVRMCVYPGGFLV